MTDPFLYMSKARNGDTADCPLIHPSPEHRRHPTHFCLECGDLIENDKYAHDRRNIERFTGCPDRNLYFLCKEGEHEKCCGDIGEDRRFGSPRCTCWCHGVKP